MLSTRGNESLWMSLSICCCRRHHHHIWILRELLLALDRHLMWSAIWSDHIFSQRRWFLLLSHSKSTSVCCKIISWRMIDSWRRFHLKMWLVVLWQSPIIVSSGRLAIVHHQLLLGNSVSKVASLGSIEKIVVVMIFICHAVRWHLGTIHHHQSAVRRHICHHCVVRGHYVLWRKCRCRSRHSILGTAASRGCKLKHVSWRGIVAFSRFESLQRHHVRILFISCHYNISFLDG